MITETKRSKYTILNELNSKYNLYHFEITCYEEAYQFYNTMAEVMNLDTPAVQVEEQDYQITVFIVENWAKYK